ncbi:MAG TPA: biopolymer transporter ExbD [Chromatiales bacterium]|nr:biopolymer transporter ExbD [Chromatiales bacterium]
MAEHHQRRKDRNASLNMVSLMDIFTILVFFLLVSAVNTEVLPTPKHIKLPESTAEKSPKENIIVMVNNRDILVQGRKVANARQAIRSNQSIIPSLLDTLKNLAASNSKKHKRLADPKRGITIMGDQQIPYALLKKIMLTCASADYTNISLAVVQKAAPGDAAP